MALQYSRFETSIAFANALNARSSKTRFPRPRHVRSLWFYADLVVSVGTITEIASPFEAIEQIEIEWDGFQSTWHGRQLPMIHQDHWGKPVIVEHGCYRDASITGSQDCGATFRLPIGAVARPNHNIDITIRTFAGAAWAEDTTAIDATSPTLDIFIAADYTDETPSVSYVTWIDVREAMNAQTDFSLPLHPNSSLETIYITTTDDRDDWIPEATAANRYPLNMNYEPNLTDLELDMGLAETWDMSSVIPAIQHPTFMLRPGEDDESLAAYESVLSRLGDYVIHVSQNVTSEPRLRLNATTTDLLLCCVYAVGNPAGGGAPPTASTPFPPGGPSIVTPGGPGGGGSPRLPGAGSGAGTRPGPGGIGRVVSRAR